MRTRLLIVIFFSAFYSGLSAQDWVHSVAEGDNIYTSRQQFSDYWANDTLAKGRGYKQFERWFNFWEPRLFPTGEFSTISSKSHADLLRNHPTNAAQRDGGNWLSLGLSSWNTSSTAPGNGRVNCIAIFPNDANSILVGSPSGGLWKTTDLGVNWIPLTDHLPTLGVSAIAINPNNLDEIYIGTGDSDNADTYSLGVLKSSDGGQTWGTTGLFFDLSENVRTHRLLMHPDNPEILYAATSIGLYRSVNAGLTWEELLTGNVRDFEFHVDDPAIILVTTNRIFRSIDGGDNFVSITTNLPAANDVVRIALAVTEADPDRIYALFADDFYNAFQGLYRSNDAGQTWALQSDTPNILSSTENGSSLYGQAWYDMVLAASHENPDIVIVGGVNLWDSDDGGVSWSLNSYWQYPGGGGINYVHADIHHLEFIGTQLWCGTDGGIYRSVNNASSFSNLSSGLSIGQFYRIGPYAQSSEIILGGTQDNGANILVDGQWTHIHGGDGMEMIIDPNNSDILYLGTQYGDFYKSIDGGNTFDWAASGITEDGAWTTPLIMSPVNSNVLYAGYENVWRSLDGGDSWVKISDFNNEQLRSLSMGLIDPNTIYAASYETLYKTNNAGSDWTNLSFLLPDEAISSITVDPLDVDRVWVSFSGFENGEKVYYTENGGTTWANISLNLPNIPVNDIVFDPSTTDGVYVGTDLGVYYKSEQLAHWEAFNDGLPNVIINELEVHPVDGKLIAATYGRGVWITDLWQEPEEAPTAQIALGNFFGCAGTPIQILDASEGNSPSWNWIFPGGNPATSGEMNPVVTYAQAGDYDITLEVNNVAGTSSITCTNCITVYPALGEDLPIQEGFESAVVPEDASWYATQDPSGQGWAITSEVGQASNQCAWLSNYVHDSNTVYELVSQTFDFSAVENESDSHLAFDYAYCGIDANNEDRLRLYVSTDCGQTWGLRAQWLSADLITASNSETSFTPQGIVDWDNKIWDLPSADHGGTISFKFWFRGGYGNNFYLDNINIWNGDLSVSELENPGFVIYPNPASTELNVVFGSQFGGPVEFRVRDRAGRLVNQTIKNLSGASKCLLAIDELADGYYFLEVVGGGNWQTIPFVKVSN
jgi:PKD repeat protein